VRRLLDRRLLLAGYAVYLLAVLYLVLWPQPDTPGRAVTSLADVLHRVGFEAVTDVHVEVGLNVVLFVPLGAIGMLLWRLPWWSWGPVGLAFSVFLEAFQWAFLPDRTPTVSDLVANTAGALLGAGAVALVLREVRASGDRSTAAPPAVHPRLLVVTAGFFAVVALVLVWAPTADLPTAVVRGISRWMWEAGAPRWVAMKETWERLLNVLLFVPFGVLAALARPGWSLVRWAAVGFTGSLVIELVQAAVFPGRDATVSDLLTNTLGMVLGAWLAGAVTSRLAVSGESARR
jgi:glycopeptide antibiotics resistance protein